MSTMILENKNTDKEPVIQTDEVLRKEDAPAVENNMGPTLQNVLLITERNNVDQTPQEKEFDLLSESSRFPGTQRAVLSSRRDGVQAIKKEKEKDPQGKCSSDCSFEEDGHHQAVCPGHQLIDRLRGRGFRPVSQWCHYLAWTLCLLLALSCLLLSAVLGMR